MSDKLNEQADKMREMAQATLDKAKDAVSKYMAESQKMRAKVAGTRRSEQVAHCGESIGSACLWHF